MHGRLALGAGLFVIGCTTSNPAFDLGADGDGGGSAGEGSSVSASDGDGDSEDASADGASADGASADGAPDCDPATATADDTTCDGIDDDCDGRIDDDYVEVHSCGLGQCAANSTASSCVDGVETPCLPGDPVDEQPGDGIDQDCDGEDAAPAPPIDSFSDDFEDGVLDPRWSDPSCSEGCSVEEISGRAQFTLGNGGPCSCSMSTAQRYSLTGQDVVLDVPAITFFFEPLRFYMAVINDAGDTIEYGFDGSDVFYAEVTEGGSTTFEQTSAYEPRPRYWRIREQGGQLWFESSASGDAWDVEMQTETPFPLGAVRFRFGSRVAGPMASNVGIGVPNYNRLR